MSYHELRPLIDLRPHIDVCVDTSPRCMRVVSSLCPVSFSSPATLCPHLQYWPFHLTDPCRLGVSRIMKLLSYSCSSWTDAIYYCCCNQHQHSQFIEDNSEHYSSAMGVIHAHSPSNRFTILCSQPYWLSRALLPPCRAILLWRVGNTKDQLPSFMSFSCLFSYHVDVSSGRQSIH